MDENGQIIPVAEITIQEPGGMQTFRVVIEALPTGDYFGSLIEDDGMICSTRRADTRAEVFGQLAMAIWDRTEHTDALVHNKYTLPPVGHIQRP